MDSISYSDARQNLARIWDRVIAGRETVILKRRGKEDLALLPAEDLSSLLETLHLIGTPANARRLLEAIEWAQTGDGAIQSTDALKHELGLTTE